MKATAGKIKYRWIQPSSVEIQQFTIDELGVSDTSLGIDAVKDGAADYRSLAADSEGAV